MEYQFIYPFLFNNSQSSRCNRKSPLTTTPYKKNQDSKPTWNPKIDIGESEQSYILKAELPGVKKDDINLTIDKDTLTISGEKKDIILETGPSTPSKDTHNGDIELPSVEEDSSKPSTSSSLTTTTSSKVDDDEETKPKVQYYRREISYGKFSRSFELAKDLDIESISAKHYDGILEITIPKKKQLAPKKVNIQIN